MEKSASQEFQKINLRKSELQWIKKSPNSGKKNLNGNRRQGFSEEGTSPREDKNTFNSSRGKKPELPENSKTPPLKAKGRCPTNQTGISQASRGRNPKKEDDNLKGSQKAEGQQEGLHQGKTQMSQKIQMDLMNLAATKEKAQEMDLVMSPVMDQEDLKAQMTQT